MPTPKHQKGVITIVAVLIIGLFVLSTALVIYTNMFRQMSHNRNVISGDQVFYTADSAMREGMYQFLPATEGAYSSGTIPLLNNATGTITVTKKDCANMVVSGLSAAKMTNRKALETIQVYPLECTVFNYGVYAANQLEFIGNSIVINGNVFLQSPYPVPEDYKDNVNGEIVAGSPLNLEINQERYLIAAPPTLFNTASDAEKYLKGKKKTTVVFVNEAADVKTTSVDLDGSLWTEGNLTISGNSTLKASDSYAAIVVKGDLTITGNTEITGVVYVAGNTTLASGSTTITGSLICMGNTVTLGGNLIVNYDSAVLNSWKDISGLNPVYDPQIVHWEEK